MLYFLRTNELLISSDLASFCWQHFLRQPFAKLKQFCDLRWPFDFFLFLAGPVVPGGSMAFIRTLKAREILDSRGNPTIEAATKRQTSSRIRKKSAKSANITEVDNPRLLQSYEFSYTKKVVAPGVAFSHVDLRWT